METHSIDRNSIIVIIKGKPFVNSIIKFIPHTVYTGNELLLRR